MEKKFCCICGREILPTQPYYNTLHHDFICDNGDCFEKYYWKTVIDSYPSHDQPIINGVAYLIGAETDDPRGFSGKNIKIRFFDGVERQTFSLWYKGPVPSSLREQLPDNAEFLEGMSNE